MSHNFTDEVDLLMEGVHDAICESCSYSEGCNSPDDGWCSTKCKNVNRHLELERSKDLIQYILDRI